jgi:hypothetical protein
MLIKSTKHVDLPNETYLGIWKDWVVTIAFSDEDMEVPVSKGNGEEPKRVRITVINNSFSFEG